VGHAGTLDPMATGVLVISVGEGTKLVPYLTAQDKEYAASIALGSETDTLDAEGAVTHQCEPLESLSIEDVRAAAKSFVGTVQQTPPAVSAIKLDGERMHARVRRGEQVTPRKREVTVESIDIRAASPSKIELSVACGKGFYVRSLARDLSRALGTCGHLDALRRTRSGPFAVEEAVEPGILRAAAVGDDEARKTVFGAAMSLAEAWAGPFVVLNEEGVEHAFQGRPVPPSAIRPAEVSDDRRSSGDSPFVAMLDAEGSMVAIASPTEGGTYRVVRGFRTS